MKLKILGLIALFTLSANSLFARSLDEIKKAGKIRVAFDASSPPFNFYKGKEVVGFEVDLAHEIARFLGVEMEIVVQPFNTLLVALDAKDAASSFDWIGTAHAMTPARQAVADFVNPHYCTNAVLVTKKGGPTTVKELKNKIVVVPVGTVYYEALKKRASEIGEIKTVPNETDALQNLLMDKAQAWVSDQFIAQEAIGKRPEQKLVMGEAIMEQQNAFVVKKGNFALRDALNAALEKVLTNGIYAKLSQQYFKSDIRCKKH